MLLLTSASTKLLCKSTYVGVQVQSEALQEDLFAIIYLQSDALHLYLQLQEDLYAITFLQV